MAASLISQLVNFHVFQNGFQEKSNFDLVDKVFIAMVVQKSVKMVLLSQCWCKVYQPYNYFLGVTFLLMATFRASFSLDTVNDWKKHSIPVSVDIILKQLFTIVLKGNVGGHQ